MAMEFPATLKYTEEHEWVRVEENNIVYIGITDFAQGELGELVYIEIETVGESFEKGEIFGTVEAVKTTSDLFMPLSGTILEVNAALTEDGDDDATLVNSDPYGKGWLVKIEISAAKEIEELMDVEAYQALVA